MWGCESKITEALEREGNTAATPRWGGGLSHERWGEELMLGVDGEESVGAQEMMAMWGTCEQPFC